MTPLERFIANNPPLGKSKLDAHKDDILHLKKLGYRESDILRYLLEEKAVKVSQRTLNVFINRHFKNQEKSNSNIQKPQILQTKEQLKTEPIGSVSSQSNSSETKVGKKPFNWEAAKEEDWRDLI